MITSFSVIIFITKGILEVLVLHSASFITQVVLSNNKEVIVLSFQFNKILESGLIETSTIILLTLYIDFRVQFNI